MCCRVGSGCDCGTFGARPPVLISKLSRGELAQGFVEFASLVRSIAEFKRYLGLSGSSSLSDLTCA